MEPRVLLLLGAVLAAVGQLLLKAGATGAQVPIDFVNARVAAGLACYAVGTVLWLIALAKLPLSRVYPFTILTFVIVYVASVWILKEQVTGSLLVGVALVLCGLVVIAIG